jgi:hypothetical protein
VLDEVSGGELGVRHGEEDGEPGGGGVGGEGSQAFGRRRTWVCVSI